MSRSRRARAETLGERLKRLRLAARLSQRTMAARAGFTPGFLSQVEHGLASPSIGSLEKLADAIGIGLAGLFAPATPATAGPGLAPTVLKLGGGTGHRSAWSRTRLEVLSAPEGSDRLEVLLLWVEPEGRTASRSGAAAQEQIAIVLSGRLELEQDRLTTSLRAREAVHLPSGTRHAWLNTSPAVAQLLLVRLAAPAGQAWQRAGPVD